MNQTIYEKLATLTNTQNIKVNEPLNHYTFTKTGGQADYLVTPTNYEEVQNVYRFAKENSIPVTVLGSGANLIIKDGGIRGIVIILSNLNKIQTEGNRIIAQSGAAIIETSKEALKHSLTGLEFACGIPGSIGGALYMNAGAYGGEIKDVLKGAVVLNQNGDIVTLTENELVFGYRTSVFSKKHYVILEGTFELEAGDKAAIQTKMEELTTQRESKQPLEYPSCGSVFKRPEGYFAGKLIQDSGLQGKQIGGVQVSTKHAGFMVNVDNATATDYINLIQYVQDTVESKFGVRLETEVKIIGED